MAHIVLWFATSKGSRAQGLGLRVHAFGASSVRGSGFLGVRPHRC